MKKNPFGPKGWTPDLLGSLAGKTYVITGANTGAGFEASRVLLSKGAEVVMLNRNPQKSMAAIEQLKAEHGADAKVRFIQLDLSKLASVRSGAAEAIETVPKIDALICNAAIAQVAKQELTVDGFESQLGVNHFGHFLLTGLLYERVEESSGRFVMVGSNAYRMGLKRIKFEDLNFDEKYSAWDSYAQSKLAQIMFGYELHRRSQEARKNVAAYVCHPGASRTSLIRSNTGLATRVMWKIMSPFAQSAERGSWPEVMCATHDGLEAERYYGPTRAEMTGPVGECQLHEHALDREAAKRLWTISEEKTGLSWSP